MAKAEYGVIEGTIVYAKLAQADQKYQSKDFEYSIEVIVSEDVADEWDAKFKKQPAKKIRAADFEAKYKIPVPDQYKKEKNLYSIKLKKDATKDGEPFNPEYRPKVFLDTADERIDITTSRLVANGSYGKVSYRVTSNDFGTFAKLNNVLFDEEGFIEYEKSLGSGYGSEFGESKPVKVEPENKKATEGRKPREAPAKELPKKAEDSSPADDFDSDEVPF